MSVFYTFLCYLRVSGSETTVYLSSSETWHSVAVFVPCNVQSYILSCIAAKLNASALLGPLYLMLSPNQDNDSRLIFGALRRRNKNLSYLGSADYILVQYAMFAVPSGSLNHVRGAATRGSATLLIQATQQSQVIAIRAHLFIRRNCAVLSISRKLLRELVHR